MLCFLLYVEKEKRLIEKERKKGGGRERDRQKERDKRER